jgi:hypothetical protein
LDVPHAQTALADVALSVLSGLHGARAQTPLADVAPQLRDLGFEPGWGASVGAVRETMHLLADVIHAPDAEGLQVCALVRQAIPMWSQIWLPAPFHLLPMRAAEYLECGGQQSSQYGMGMSTTEKHALHPATQACSAVFHLLRLLQGAKVKAPVPCRRTSQVPVLEAVEQASAGKLMLLPG